MFAWMLKLCDKMFELILFFGALDGVMCGIGVSVSDAEFSRY